MSRISVPLEHMKTHYTVVVVGSGYGGAIAATRMAQTKRQSIIAAWEESGDDHRLGPRV